MDHLAVKPCNRGEDLTSRVLLGLFLTSAQGWEFFYLPLTVKEFWSFLAQTAYVTRHMTHTIHMGRYRNNKNMVTYMFLSRLKW